MIELRIGDDGNAIGDMIAEQAADFTGRHIAIFDHVMEVSNDLRLWAESVDDLGNVVKMSEVVTVAVSLASVRQLSEVTGFADGAMLGEPSQHDGNLSLAFQESTDILHKYGNVNHDQGSGQAAKSITTDDLQLDRQRHAMRPPQADHVRFQRSQKLPRAPHRTARKTHPITIRNS